MSRGENKRWAHGRAGGRSGLDQKKQVVWLVRTRLIGLWTVPCAWRRNERRSPTFPYLTYLTILWYISWAGSRDLSCEHGEAGCGEVARHACEARLGACIRRD
jgi:hypothetical protein